MSVKKSTEVAISSQFASIKLYRKDIEPDGSVQLSVRMVGYGFSGCNPNVWVSREDLRSFLADLRSLERSRTGEARLSSMSPGELDLHIRITSPAGHARVEAALSQTRFIEGFEPASVSFGYPFDPSYLPSILASFERIAEGASRR